ncbi:MAG TPA: hypothetical protein VF158_02135 [Longimicrobiales bacterium]
MSTNTWPAATAAEIDESREGRGVGAVRGEHGEEEAPVGTVFFMILFLMVMVGLWITVYGMLLER